MAIWSYRMFSFSVCPACQSIFQLSFLHTMLMILFLVFTLSPLADQKNASMISYLMLCDWLFSDLKYFGGTKQTSQTYFYSGCLKWHKCVQSHTHVSESV